MSYTSLDEFKQYSNIFSDNEELQQSYIEAAENIIEGYLGYNLSSPEAEDILRSPALLKITTLRIASLLQSEDSGNIGVTSKSFGDSGTRTFINTVNFDKYLIQISNYRKIRI